MIHPNARIDNTLMIFRTLISASLVHQTNPSRALSENLLVIGV